MSTRRKRIGFLPLALAAAVLAGAPPAQAANLFDVLFGGGAKRSQVKAFPPAPPSNRVVGKPKRSKITGGARISAPTYYTYKADPLVRVDFSPLAPTFVPVAFKADAETFSDALVGLNGFDLFAEQDIAKALIEHYAATPQFIWVANGAPNAKALDAIRILNAAAGHGLDASDYAVAIPSGPNANSLDSGNGLMIFEMTLSARVLRYIHDVSIGRVDPSRISGYYDLIARPLNVSGVLNVVAASPDIVSYLNSRSPQSSDYRALQAELLSLHASADDTVVIDPKLLLKPGETSPELPKLLKVIARDFDAAMTSEFGEILTRLQGSEVYDPELKPVIQAVQKRAGLQADGIIGPRTVAIFVGVSKAERIEKVKIALEQRRWLPEDFGATHVFVNQPAFIASYIEGNEAKLSMRVVVGAPSTQTSFFYDEIETVDYNPYWGVPQSIIVNEMLPRLRNDPGYLDRSGYEVTDAKGRKVPSSSVNWAQYGAKVPYNVRQAPSEANALGELKILFPNKNAIYMHDTPSKSFFARDMRAISHGCIRLQNPRGMAAAVLGTTVEHVKEKLARGHSTETLPRKIPIYIAYFTAWPTMDGKVEYFGDVYGRDERMKLALDATEAARTPSM